FNPTEERVNFLSRAKVGTKLSISYLATLVLMVAVGLFSMFQLNRLNTLTPAISFNRLPSAGAVSRAAQRVTPIGAWEYRLLAASDAERPQALEALHESIVQVQEPIKTFAALERTAEEDAIFQRTQRNWVAYLSTSEKLQQLVGSGQIE